MKGKAKYKAGENPKPMRQSGIGSTQLARETGYSQPRVSALLKRGETPASIRARALAKGYRPGDKRPRGNPAARSAVAQAAPSFSGAGGAYVPSRKIAAAKAAAIAAAKSKPEPTPQLASTGRPATVVQGETMSSASLRKAIADANQKELEYNVRLNELGSLSMLHAWISGIVVAARDIWMRFPGEMADRLAGVIGGDPVVIRGMLEPEVQLGLDKLQSAADRLADEMGSVSPENVDSSEAA